MNNVLRYLVMGFSISLLLIHPTAAQQEPPETQEDSERQEKAPLPETKQASEEQENTQKTPPQPPTQTPTQTPTVVEDPILLKIGSYPEKDTWGKNEIEKASEFLYVLRGERDPSGGVIPSKLYLEKFKWLRNEKGILGIEKVTGKHAAIYPTTSVTKGGKTYDAINLRLNNPLGGHFNIILPYTLGTYDEETQTQSLTLHGIEGLPAFAAGGNPSTNMVNKVFTWTLQKDEDDTFDLFGDIGGEKIKLKQIMLGLRGSFTWRRIYGGVETFRLMGEKEQTTPKGETRLEEVQEDTPVTLGKTETEGYCYTRDPGVSPHPFPSKDLEDFLKNNLFILDQI